MSFIKKEWKVKCLRDFSGVAGGTSVLTKNREYIVYEVNANCWLLSDDFTKTKFHTKYIYLDDKDRYRCCTADCEIQRAFDFKNGRSTDVVIAEPLYTSKVGYIDKTTKKKIDNKKLFGI